MLMQRCNFAGSSDTSDKTDKQDDLDEIVFLAKKLPR